MKKKKTKRPKNKYAKDLRTPKYKKRVVPDKSYKAFVLRLKKEFDDYLRKYQINE